MKKYKCSKCGNVCGYVMSDFVNMPPVLCPRGVRFGAEWREEESMQGKEDKEDKEIKEIERKMKKFECKMCTKPCILKVEDNAFSPSWCPYGKRRANWQAVKEDKEIKGLPEWVKECAIGYDNEQERYFEVTNVSENGVDIEFPIGICATLSYSDMQNCSEARKRPFNAEEMRGLIGKVIRADFVYYLVHTYLEYKGGKVLIGNENHYNADGLMGFTVDGKPCYVLEHKNEKGEWVE